MSIGIGIGNGISIRSGSPHWTPPNNLTVIWENDYAKLTWTDNTFGVAAYEIWESINGSIYTLNNTTEAGATTINAYVWQNGIISIKIRAKSIDKTSRFVYFNNFSAPLVLKTDQSTLTAFIFNTLNIAVGKTVNIDWGDGTNQDVTGDNTNLTKNYGDAQNPYYIKLTGDVDFILAFVCKNQIKNITDISKWKYPINSTYIQISGNRNTGDISLISFPENLQVFSIDSNLNLIGDLTNVQFKESQLDIQYGNNKLTGDISNWQFPMSLPQIIIYDNDFTGDISNWVLPNNITYPYVAIILNGNRLTGDLSGWIIFPTLLMLRLEKNSILATDNEFTGDLSDWDFPICPPSLYDSYSMDWKGDFQGFSGDWSGKSITESHVPIEISFIDNDFTGLPRGYMAWMSVYNFTNNICSESEVDSFLAYIDNYFTGGIVPLSNCVYSLGGDRMSAPSAAGMTSRTSIINKYIAAGKTCTINYHVDITEPSNLLISTNPVKGQQGLTLGWTDNSGGVSLYEIYESIDGSDYVLINTTLAGVVTYARSIVIGSSLGYKIRGVDAMGNTTAFIQKIITLGSELVDQDLWNNSPVSSYWNKYSVANWSADGTKLSSNGSNGDLGRNNFWVTDKMYKVVITITRTSGALVPPFSTVAADGISASKTYNMTVGLQTALLLYSNAFNGTITGLSIKEIVVT